MASRDESKVSVLVKSVDRRQYNVLFTEEIILGLLNNYGYTLVIAGAQDIARLFNKTNLMPLFTTVMLFAAFATGALHARLAAPYSYRQRVGLAMIIQSIGYLLFGTAFLFVGVLPEVGFWMAQIATFLVGAFQTIGEINNLSILNSLPNGLVGAWGFGTGVSQFIGSVSYVLAINLGVPYSTFFLSLIPVYLIYWALFIRVEKLARQNKEDSASETLLGGEQQQQQSLKLSAETFPNVVHMGGGIILNMAATYAFNYLIESGFADRATLHPSPYTQAIAVNSYALGVSIYGIGTMLARLSVAWFPTRRIGLITFIQLVNSILWGFEAYYHTIRYSFGLYAWFFYQIWMFIVGWIAGMSYSNCLNVISLSKNIPFQYRELVMNVGFIFSNVAVVAATGSSIIMNNTFMSEQLLYPPTS